MSKVKKSCSISQWLKKHDKKLWDACDNACAIGLFRTTKTAGLTFLYPDGPVKKKLMDLLDYNDYEGVRILQSLLIVDCLPNPEDWASKKDDIPNKLGIKVKISSVGNQDVVLGNGVKIKPIEPKKFTPRKDRGNMSIWLYKGPVPDFLMEGEKSSYKYVKKGAPKKQVKGGFFNKGLNPFGLARACQGKAVGLIASGKYDYCNPYVDVLCSYMSYLKKNDKNAYDECLQCVSYCPESTFYNILEPFCEDSNPKHFKNWLNETQGITLVNSSAKKYLGIITDAADISEKNRKEESEKRKIVYKKLFPASLKKTLNKLYESSKGGFVKAQKDEIQFMILERLNDLKKLNGIDDARTFSEICFEVEIMQRNGPKKGRYITSDDMTKYMDAVGFYSSAALFTLSDCFMYAPYLIDDDSQKKQLGSTDTGHELTIVDSNDVTIDDLRSDSVLVITQNIASDRLTKLAENQKEKNPQEILANVLGKLEYQDMDDSLKNCIKDLASKMQGGTSYEEM